MTELANQTPPPVLKIDEAAVTSVEIQTKKTKKQKRMCLRLDEKSAWNPLRQYPRNKSCFCGSGNKAKRCCLDLMAQAVDKDTAKYIADNWGKLLTGRVTMKRPT